MKYLISALMVGALCFGMMGCGADKATVEKATKDIAALQQTATALQGDVDALKASVKGIQDEMAAAKAPKVDEKAAAKAAAKPAPAPAAKKAKRTAK